MTGGTVSGFEPNNTKEEEKCLLFLGVTDENGATGYVNCEPEVGAQTEALPEWTTEIEYDGVTYHQFDMVFFEQVEDENDNPFYEVVDAPGDDEVTELASS